MGLGLSSFARIRRSLRALATVATLVLVATLAIPVSGWAAKGGGPPIAISVSANPSPVASGDELTYTVVVTNLGGAQLTEVAMTDQVNDLTGTDGTNNLVLSSSLGGCTQSQNTAGMLVYCEAPTLQGFETWTITIRGQVLAANGSVLNNTATATGTKSATTFTVSDTASTQVKAGGDGSKPDLTIAINAPSTIPPSSDYFYTLLVNNEGGKKASDIVVTATLPADAEFKTQDASSLFDCVHDGSPTGGVVVCSGGALNEGANATIHLYATSSPSNNTSMTISAAVDPFDAIVEASELNNYAQATTDVTTAPPDKTLAITKTDTPDPVAEYDGISYTITVTNTSSFRADYVSVVDGTQGLDAASITASTTVGTCSVAAPTVTCETTRFQPGEVMEITITGIVVARAGSTIINTATVNGNIKNKGVTNTATAITTVRPAVDLTVTQYRTFPTPPDPVRAADRFDWTITVGNSGLHDATDVLVREPLPTGVYFDGFAASVGGTSCGVDASNVLTCTIPVVQGATSSGLPQGSTETITLFLIAPHAIGQITGVVTVDPLNSIPESDEANNTYTTVTDVLTGIDLTITKDHNFSPIARNGTLRYTIEVSNIGTQDTDGVMVVDELPAGSVFRSAQGDHNFTCGNSGDVVTCSGGIIRGTYSGSLTLPVDVATIIIDVFAPDEPGIYHNEVRVDPSNTIPEIDESNNFFLLDTVVENGQSDGAYVELSVSDIVDSFDPIATSGMLDYTLTILNTGQAAAYNVEVEIALPAGATFRDANDLGAAPGEFVCGESAGVVTCAGGTVEGANGMRQILVRTFAPPFQTTALLEATVDPANAIGEADEANNENDETTVVVAGGPGSHVELSVFDIVDSFDPVAPSGTLDYDVTIQNTGAADAFDVSFRADLPPGTTFRYADDLGPTADAFSCTAATGVVTCTGARINTGTSRVVRIGVFAPSQPGTIRLDVSVDPANAIPEGHEGNNTAEEYTTVQLGGGGGFIDLQVTKTHQQPDPTTAPGANVTYIVKVLNAGTDDAFNVMVRDPLPAGMTFVSASADGGNFVCQESGGVVDCTGGYVKGSNSGGGARTITIVAKAPLQHDVVVKNQVFVDPLNAIAEADETNNSAWVEVTIKSRVNLRVEITDTNISQGSTGTITFTAYNEATADGMQDANGVKVEFNAPVGTIVQNVTAPAGWSCATFENAVNHVECTGFMEGGSSDAFQVEVYKTASGQSNDNAVIDPDDTIVESKEIDNTDQGTA